MLRSALLEGGYPDLSSEIDKSCLLSAARTFCQESIQKVERDCHQKGKTIRWEVAPQRLILDRLFAINSIIGPFGKTEVKEESKLQKVWTKQFAFDVTFNSEEVAKKVEKHRNLLLDGIWNQAGLSVTKSAVILLVPSKLWGNEWGWSLLNTKQQENFVEEVLQVVYGMDERSVAVTTHIISF